MQTVTKASLTLLFSLTLASAGAQTYNNPENFSLGDRAVYKDLEVTGKTVNPGSGGSGMVWDFTNLNSWTSHDYFQEIVLPSGTPYAQDHPKAVLCEQSSDSTYVYLTKSGTELNLVGFSSKPDELSIKYSDPQRIMRWPMAYKDSISDTFRRTFKIDKYDMAGTGYCATVVDGKGTLKLPNGTYENVIRVRFDQKAYDTMSALNNITITEVHTYAWFDASHKYSLLKIDMTSIKNAFFTSEDTTIRYLTEEHTSGITRIGKLQELPGLHYANGQVTIFGQLPQTVLQAVIIDAQGRICQQQILSGSSLQTGMLSKGLYFLQLRDRNSGSPVFQAAKFTVQ